MPSQKTLYALPTWASDAFVSIFKKIYPFYKPATITDIAYLSGVVNYIMPLPKTDITLVMDDSTKMMEMTDHSL